MIAAVADTHTALWYLFGESTSLGSRQGLHRPGGRVRRKAVLSVISPAEILYLIEKNRLPFSAYERLRQALGAIDCVIDEAPLTTGVVEAMQQVPRAEVPDMPDRIVAATGVYFGARVISSDGRIRASSLLTVW